jgi:hypothetical protein
MSRDTRSPTKSWFNLSIFLPTAPIMFSWFPHRSSIRCAYCAKTSFRTKGDLSLLEMSARLLRCAMQIVGVTALDGFFLKESFSMDWSPRTSSAALMRFMQHLKSELGLVQKTRLYFRKLEQV